MIICFLSAEALVLRSGVLTRKSMYIDGIFLYLFLSDRAVLFFSFFFRYLAMQFLASTGFRILTVNRPWCLLSWRNDFFLLDQDNVFFLFDQTRFKTLPPRFYT